MVVFMLLMLIIHLFLVVNVKRGFRKQIISPNTHSFGNLNIAPLISQPYDFILFFLLHTFKRDGLFGWGSLDKRWCCWGRLGKTG